MLGYSLGRPADISWYYEVRRNLKGKNLVQVRDTDQLILADPAGIGWEKTWRLLGC